MALKTPKISSQTPDGDGDKFADAVNDAVGEKLLTQTSIFEQMSTMLTSLNSFATQQFNLSTKVFKWQKDMQRDKDRTALDRPDDKKEKPVDINKAQEKEKKGVFGLLFGLLTSMFGGLLGIVKKFVPTRLTKIFSSIRNAKWLKGILSIFGKGGKFAKFFSSFKNVFKPLLKGIKFIGRLGKMLPFVGVIIQAIDGVINMFRDWESNSKKAKGSFFKLVAMSLNSFVSGILEGLSFGMISQDRFEQLFSQLFTGRIGDLWENIKGLFTDFWKNIQNTIFAPLGEWIGELLMATFVWYKSKMILQINPVLSAFRNFGQRVSQLWTFINVKYIKPFLGKLQLAFLQVQQAFATLAFKLMEKFSWIVGEDKVQLARSQMGLSNMMVGKQEENVKTLSDRQERAELSDYTKVSLEHAQKVNAAVEANQESQKLEAEQILTSLMSREAGKLDKEEENLEKEEGNLNAQREILDEQKKTPFGDILGNMMKPLDMVSDFLSDKTGSGLDLSAMTSTLKGLETSQDVENQKIAMQKQQQKVQAASPINVTQTNATSNSTANTLSAHPTDARKAPPVSKTAMP